jgi:alpha-L-rhamnosidase
MKLTFLLPLLGLTTLLTAQTIRPELLKKPWSAYWVAVPNESPKNHGVYLFRKSVKFSTKPDSFIIHVSADNRYKLFVNGKMVPRGARSTIGIMKRWILRLFCKRVKIR